LQNPILIRESAKEADVHLYYNKFDRGFLCVVTAPSRGDDHFVVTVYFTKNIKEGKELWIR
jgi:hypothetical protein